MTSGDEGFPLPARRLARRRDTFTPNVLPKDRPDPALLRPVVVVCQRCDGAGWVGTNKSFGDPLFGKAVVCPRCRNAPRMQLLMGNASVLPEDLVAMKADWNTFPKQMNRAAIEDAKSYVQRIFGEEMADTRGLILYGENQIGKTGLAYCIHKELTEGGIASGFITTIDLLDRLHTGMFDKERPDRHLDILDMFCTVQHLVLDDVGAEKVTEKREEWLFMLLNRRVKTPGLVTTITTNLGPAGMLAHLGARITSRLFSDQIEVLKLEEKMGHLVKTKKEEQR